MCVSLFANLDPVWHQNKPVSLPGMDRIFAGDAAGFRFRAKSLRFSLGLVNLMIPCCLQQGLRIIPSPLVGEGQGEGVKSDSV
jgi:hypothetical protein